MRWLRAAAVTLGLLLLAAVILLLSFRFLHGGPCEQGSLPCSTSPSWCIPQRSWCNGHVDCPNGDDENKIHCADFSGSNDLPFLEFINYSRRHRPTNRGCQLTGHPSQCRCKDTSLNCGGVGLSFVPSHINGNITRLILLNNTIGNLNSTSFTSLPALKLINLQNNSVARIGRGTFSGMTNLEKLLLSNNKLSQWLVYPGEMEDLSSLMMLLLDANSLTDRSWPLAELGALKSLQWLGLSGNELLLENQEFPKMKSLKELNLTRNSMVYVAERTFMRLNTLSLLELRHNAITEIHPAAFRSLINLHELDLAYNLLHSLPSHLFDSLAMLSQLDLSGNPLVLIPAYLFVHLQNLTSLSLENIDIDNIDVQMFSDLPRLKYVYFKFYYYCSFVPQVPICKPNNDGVSSMQHLLHALPLRLTVWVVAAFTLSANILVLSGRAASHDDNRVLSLVVRSLAASDLLMGVYLALIASADEIMRGNYNRRAHTWMTSWMCTAAGVTSMLSSEVSVMTLVFMSLDRFLLIADPLGRNLMSFDSSAKCVMAIWMSGLILAILPVTVHWQTSTRFYGTNGMCFPLHIDDPFLAGWQYSTFVFLGVNGASLLLIAILYMGMFMSIVRTRRATPLTVGDVDVAVRFFFIVLTDVCCWAPIAVMKILALARIHISAEVYAWVIVFLIPINSAINPLLYTLTIPKYRQAVVQLVRSGLSACWGRALVPRRQSADTECSHSNRAHSAATSRTPIECSDIARKSSEPRVEQQYCDDPLMTAQPILSEDTC